MATVESAAPTGAHSSNAQADTSKVITIGSRRSPLAIAQSEIVIEILKKARPDLEFKIHAIQTMADKNLVTALPDFNAKSLWTEELEALLVAGEVDIVVHSLKDVPTQLPTQTVLGPVPVREDARDALVWHPRLDRHTTLASLPAGSVIGTSALRRSAQLRRLYPHLDFQSVRGSIGTRLAKLDAADSPYSGIILAVAGLVRMDLGGRICKYLSSEALDDAPPRPSEPPNHGPALQGMLHAVGQGGLGLQIRAGDAATAALVAAARDDASTLAAVAERSVMRTLEGGCSVPIGVETKWPTKSELSMKAIVVSTDGTKAATAVHARAVRDDADADEFGREVAAILVKHGAGDILGAITLNRQIVVEQGNA